MVIHVRRGKGSKDRYAILFDQILEFFRVYWKGTRPRHWLFPGTNRKRPLTTRQRQSACSHVSASAIGAAGLLSALAGIALKLVHRRYDLCREQKPLEVRAARECRNVAPTCGG
jgi:integrase